MRLEYDKLNIMHTWHRICLSLLLAAFFGSCSKAAEEVQISINLDGLSQAEVDQIQSFLFIVEADSENRKLFPSSCVRRDMDGNSCLAQSDSDCGFDSSEPEFLANVPHDDGAVSFPKDSAITVIGCALDSSLSVVGSGSNTVTNSDGESVSIALTAADTACATGIPAACP